jgi:hypothetical protein
MQMPYVGQYLSAFQEPGSRGDDRLQRAAPSRPRTDIAWSGHAAGLVVHACHPCGMRKRAEIFQIVGAWPS